MFFSLGFSIKVVYDIYVFLVSYPSDAINLTIMHRS
jgi:hypothetical protein